MPSARWILGPGHGHVAKNAVCEFHAVGTISEESRAEELDCGLAAQLQSLGVKRLEWKRQLHQRCTQEIKNIRAEHGIHDLKRIRFTELAGTDALGDGLLQLFKEWLEYSSEEERQRSSVAMMKANHLLLHQALKFTLGQDAIEVVHGGAQQTLSCAVCRVESRKRILHDLSGDFFDSSGVQALLAFEIVVKQRLVHSCRLCDSVSAGAGEAMRAELTHCRTQDFSAGAVGAILGFSGRSHDNT